MKTLTQLDLNLIDDEYPFLGATPDGITSDMIIEVKCPVAPFKIGIEEAIQQKKMHFYKKNKNGEVVINQKSDWYYQVQGQLHICKKQQCLFGIWYGDNKIKTEIIEKDDMFWTNVMEPKLLKFYYDCLLPELVDPRHIRNKPIRDPEYVVAQGKENTASSVNISEELNNKANSGDTVADTDKTFDVDYFAEVDDEVAVVDSSDYVMAFSEY